MQEVEVPPRDTFAHYVYVDRPERNLLWWFNTKRHNIAFGLYYLPGHVEGAQVKAELKPDSSVAASPSSGSDLSGNATPNTDGNRMLIPTAARMGRSVSVTLPNTETDEPMAATTAGGAITFQMKARNRRSGSSVSSIAASLGGGNGAYPMADGNHFPNSPNLVDQNSAMMNPAGLVRSSLPAGTVLDGSVVTAGGSPMVPMDPLLAATAVATAPVSALSSSPQSVHLAQTGTPTIPQSASPAASIISASGVIAPLNNTSPSNLPPPPPTPTMRSRQRTNFRPKDPRMQELLPVEVCESSRRTIQGQYEVKEPGTYVFIFDNSFSWNTTKRLTFFVAAKDGPSESTAKLDYAGWVLKKKRKMMQGWAKRWVQIEDGVLSYGKYPHSTWRGSVRIVLSTISVMPQHRTIHIDSGTSTYHMKAINDENFKQCVDALRRYKSLSNYMPAEGDLTEGPSSSHHQHHHTSSSISSNDLRVATLKSQQTALLAGMAPHESGAFTSPIDLELENILVMLTASARASLDESSLVASGAANGINVVNQHRTSPSISNTSIKQGQTAKSGGKLRFSFTPNRDKRESAGNGDTATSANTTGIPNDTEGTLVLSSMLLDKLKVSLDLIRRENRHQCELLQQGYQWRLLAQNEINTYRAEINELRAQLGKEALEPSASDNNASTIFDPESTWNTTMPTNISTINGNESTADYLTSTVSRRISIMSTASKASDIFFDASEDIILANDSDSDSEDEADGSGDGDKEASNATFQLSDIDNDDDDDEGIIEQVEEAIVGVVATTGGTIVGRRSSVAISEQSRDTIKQKQQRQRASRIFADSHGNVLASDSVSESPIDGGVGATLGDNTTSDTASATATIIDDSSNEVVSFERRSQLPAPTCETEISFLSLLRKNIGKDLSTIAMPVALNEPINLLQKLCEELEYSELLDQASQQTDSLERLLFVSAFVVSGYASTQYRSTRKPFNPLHGETYECVREDKGFKFISEKVSHNPPVMACHAESDNFIFHQDSKLKSKFWGKSMELSPSGTVHITLPKWNEEYTYCKPATWMRNMLAGNRYLEHSGEVRVQNHTTGEYCLLNFKEGGMFSASTNEVIGVAYNAKGKKVHTINGRWTEIMYHEREKNQLNVLWRAQPPPTNHESQYGFTTFTVQLNEMTPDVKVPGVLPITDTRLRPDQRAYEEGQVDEADVIKVKLEDEQRQRRRQMEAEGRTWQTQWFELKKHPNCKEDCWQYTGGYWEAREKRQFETTHTLW